MPYKDPNSEAAIASRKKAQKLFYERHQEQRRFASRERYAANPEKEKTRNRIWRNTIAKELRCANCGKERDRGNKVLCSICAPLHNEKVKENSRSYKSAAFDAYGGPVCQCCGDTHFEFMSIDHIKGGGAAHRKELRKGQLTGGGGIHTYLWLKRHNYPPGFRVLCRNCNSAMGELGYCPHERERVSGHAKDHIF